MPHSEPSPQNSDANSRSSPGASDDPSTDEARQGRSEPVPPTEVQEHQVADVGLPSGPRASAVEGQAAGAAAAAPADEVPHAGAPAPAAEGQHDEAAPDASQAGELVAAQGGAQRTQGDGKNGKAHESSTWDSKFFASLGFDDGAVLILIVLLPIALILVSAALSRGEEGELDVVVANDSCTNDALAGAPRLSGFVTEDGQPCVGAAVFVVATDTLGNRIKTHSTKSDENGAFQFDLPQASPSCLRGQHLVSLKVSAKSPRKWFGGGKTGSTELKLQKGGIIQDFSPFFRNTILLLFAASLLLAIFTPSSAFVIRVQHYISIVVTCLLSVLVVLAVGQVMTLVDGLPERGVARVGFATFFKGSYVKDVESEWLVSLTAPPSSLLVNPPAEDQGIVLSEPGAAGAPAAQQGRAPKDASTTNANDARKAPERDAAKRASEIQPREPRDSADGTAIGKSASKSDPVSGLGAPLWVLFLGTIGAMLLTIGLVVQQVAITDIVGSEAQARANQRTRLQTYVQHSFFVLFAPFAAIFVYQLLVAAKAAGAPMMVGIVALGTGPTLTLLLDKAVKSAGQLLEGTREHPNQNQNDQSPAGSASRDDKKDPNVKTKPQGDSQ
jgi:hypothetical protein